METPDPQPRAGLAETVTISIPERSNRLWITNTYVCPGGDYIPTDTWNSVFSGRRAILAGDLNAHSEEWDRGTPQDRRGVEVSDCGSKKGRLSSPTPESRQELVTSDKEIRLRMWPY